MIGLLGPFFFQIEVLGHELFFLITGASRFLVYEAPFFLNLKADPHDHPNHHQARKDYS